MREWQSEGRAEIEPELRALLERLWHGREERAELIASSKRTRLFRVEAGPLSSTCWFKRFIHRGPRDLLVFQIRCSRARACERGAALLLEHGFAALTALVVIEERRGMVRGESALLVPTLEPRRTAKHFFSDPRISLGERRAVLRALGAEVGRLHAAGLYHGDLNLGNVFLDYARGIAAGPEHDRFNDGGIALNPSDIGFIWIDTVRVRRFRRLPFRMRVHNFKQLAKIPTLLQLRDVAAFSAGYRSVENALNRKQLRRAIRKGLRDAAVHAEKYGLRRGPFEPNHTST